MWFDVNDSRISCIRERDLQRQFSGKESAYMLFYRRKNLLVTGSDPSRLLEVSYIIITKAMVCTTGNKNAQFAQTPCCVNTGLKAMLRVLLPPFKPV